MLAVAAMAVQDAFVQVALSDTPPTAVMTGNVTRVTLDVVEMLRGHHGTSLASARHRAVRSWPVFAGCAIGCGVGAACHALMGLGSVALPAGLAVLALRLGSADTSVDRPRRSSPIPC